MTRYERLQPIDSAFLYAESPTAHMHVGSLTIFQDADSRELALLSHVERRLHLVPRYRQKIAWVPGNQGRPVWIDDRDFDVRNHVIFTKLPASATERDLLRLASRLLGRQLERNRPLWEIWHVSLPGGRSALLTKCHHCLVDGLGAVDIGTVLLDFGPESPPLDVPPWVPEAPPTPSELLRDALVERAAQPADVMRSVRKVSQAPREYLERGKDLARGLLSFGRAGLELAPRTSFTRGIGPHRRFETVRTELGKLKTVRARLDCTVNDVLLAVVSGGLRKLLLERKETVDGLVLKAMIPVSFRAASERNTPGNRVSWVVADLPIGEERPDERVRRVQASMRAAKESNQAVAADFWLKASAYAPPTVLSLAGKALPLARMCNLVVTNVPGPQFPLFLKGGEMIDAFPVVPIAGVTSLGIAALSYNGKVGFGINADFDLFPDAEILARGIADSVEELAGGGAAERAA